MTKNWAQFAILLLLSSKSFAQPTTEISGEVFDVVGRPIPGAQITADKIGISTDTDRNGKYHVKLPPGEMHGGIRLSVSKPGFFPSELYVNLLNQPSPITLVALYTNAKPPTISRSFLKEIQSYRQSYIETIQRFLRSPEQHLLEVDAPPGQGANDVVVAALKTFQTPLIFWWRCAETDSPAFIAGEIGKALKDPYLAEFDATQSQSSHIDQARIQKIASREITSRLSKGRQVLIFQGFDRWLDKGTHRIADPLLETWFIDVSTQLRGTKVIVISGEVVVLPNSIDRSDTSKLLVEGLSPRDGARFLEDGKGLRIGKSRALALARRFNGNPFALQLVAADIKRTDEIPKQKERANEILSLQGRSLPGPELRGLFSTTISRLSADETWSLYLISQAREAITVPELRRLEALVEPRSHRGSVTDEALGELSQRFHLIDRTPSDNNYPSPSYSMPDIVEAYVDYQLSDNRQLRLALNKAYMRWYLELTAPIPAFLPLSIPFENARPFDRLAVHALIVAELSKGPARSEASMLAAKAILATYNIHAAEHNERLLGTELEGVLLFLEGPPESEARTLRADCALALADVYKFAFQPDRTERWYSEAETVYETLGDPKRTAKFMFSRGSTFLLIGRMQDAVQQMQSALASFRLGHDQAGAARALNMLGEIEARLGRRDEARRHLAEAEVLFGEQQDYFNLALVHLNLGLIEQSSEHFPEAEKYYFQAKMIAERESYSLLLATSLSSLADIHERQGQDAKSEELFRLSDSEYSKALEIFDELEERLGVTNAQFGLAYNRLYRNELGALDDMKRVRNEFVSLGEKTGILRASLVLTSAMIDLKLWKESARELVGLLLLSGKNGIQTEDVVSLCIALRQQAKSEDFDTQIDAEEALISAKDRGVISPLLARVRRAAI